MMSNVIFVFGILFIALKSVQGSMSMPTYVFMNVERTDSSGKSMEVCANFYPNLATMNGALPMARNLKEAKGVFEDSEWAVREPDTVSASASTYTVNIGRNSLILLIGVQTPLKLAYYGNDDTICSTLPENTSFAGDIVHTNLHFDNWQYASQGKCKDRKSINERILKLQAYNASAILFVTTPDETHATYYDPRVNASVVDIALYYINEQTEQKFSKFVGNNRSMASLFTLRFYVPPDPLLDVGMVVILIIATLSVSLGGLWSGHKHCELFLQEMSKRLSLPPSSQASFATRPDEPRDGAGRGSGSGEQSKPESAWAETSGTSGTEPPAAAFNWLTLVLFIVIIVGFLLLLYYLYNVVVWLVIVVYVIASASAMCECLWFFVQKIPYGKCTFRLDPLADLLTRICRCCTWKMFRVAVEYRHAGLYLFSASFAIIWCVFRHWSYSFVLHDILATCFCIVTIRNLRIPNLMWITSLLSMLLIYDLFMVFITPYITPSGCSIMIDVATGGACSRSSASSDLIHNLPPSDAPPKEELPIVIRVPRFNDPLWSCYRMEVDLQYPPVILGLGDIILPGVLIGYNAAYSLAARTPYRLYYVIGVIGYILGMIATFTALLLSRLPQPALIYLVPFTLVPTHITALIRKEWKKMWKGQFPLVEETCPILKSEGSHRDVTIGQRENPASPNRSPVSQRRAENAAA